MYVCVCVSGSDRTSLSLSMISGAFQDDATEIPFTEPKTQETPVKPSQDDAFDAFETGEWRLPASASTGALSESLDRIRDLATAVVKGNQEAKGELRVYSNTAFYLSMNSEQLPNDADREFQKLNRNWKLEKSRTRVRIH